MKHFQRNLFLRTHPSPSFTTSETHSHFHLFRIQLLSNMSPWLTTTATENIFTAHPRANTNGGQKEMKCIPRSVSPRWQQTG